MVIDARAAFNSSFSEDKYQDFLREIESQFNHRPEFRISESPVFIGGDLKGKIFKACDDINDVITHPDFIEKSNPFILPEYNTPGEEDYNLFLQYDFGICELPDGSLAPKLIELQGFPTLYFYQDLIARMYRKHFTIPENYSHLFNGHDSAAYTEYLDKIIVGSSDPENVVLLEIDPLNQPTQIDYWCTKKELGIKVLDLVDLKKDGKDLYYLNEDGRKIGVEKIYNRVIFDELVGRKDLRREFSFRDEVNVKWIGHPNWFFRVSKSTLPLLHGSSVPKSLLLSELNEIPEDLHNYVLKPLHSFSGSGVIFNVKPENIDSIENKSNFILQEKVNYSPVITSPDGKVKCEVRMIFIWEGKNKEPILINNLARLSKGEMIGVKYNKDKTWVGGSVGFFQT